MQNIYKLLLTSLNSKASVMLVVIFCSLSFYFGQKLDDMNLFAASGAVMTVFGLLSMIKLTTIEKFLNQESIVANSTGMTGKPMSPDQAEQYYNYDTHCLK